MHREVVVNATRVRDLMNSMTPEAPGENTTGMVPPYSQIRVQLGQAIRGSGARMDTGVGAGGQSAIQGKSNARYASQTGHETARGSEEGRREI